MYQPIELTSSSGIVIAEDGPHVLIYDRGLGGLAITIYVVGLIAFLMFSIGLVFTILALRVDPTFPLPLALGMLLGAAGPVTALLFLWRIVSRRRRLPLGNMTPILVFDRLNGVMRAPTGESIAPMWQVRIDRQFSVTSSSPSLVVHHPGGTLLIARPNPFAGGMRNLDTALADAISRTS